MRRPARTGWLCPLGLLLIGLPPAAPGDDRPGPPANPHTQAADDAVRAIRPLPPAAIPDDPPPHEGALVDIPLIIEPPDVVVVEVLEALPGRPITGQRLVRPDGTISLGFYGDIHVRGLTTDQAKVKIIHHLRKYLNDDVLGLRIFRADGAKVEPLPPAGTKAPVEMVVPQDRRPFEKPDVEPEPKLPPPPTAPAPAAGQPSAAARAPSARGAWAAYGVRTRRAAARPVRLNLGSAGDGDPPPQPAAAKATGPEPRAAEPEPMADDAAGGDVVAGEVVYIEPVESIRVFVDVTSHNSNVYYVQGDVGSPGRLPSQGRETVLDALTFAGGLTPTAEPTDIHIHRPSRGDKPARTYKVDHGAIVRGDRTANLQLFPGDRVVVGRNAIVQKTFETDRANAALNTLLGSYLSLNSALKSAHPAEVYESRISFTEWFDVLWGDLSQPSTTLRDPEAFRKQVARWLDRAR